jgi:2-oxo-4-hydroxy-4-carboxy-5-ureidoimidazoline decarboxylase
LDEADIDEALAGHPRIGERRAGEEGEVSRREQAGVDGLDGRLLDELASRNREYEQRFGHVYLVRASGRSAEELLTRLKGRLTNEPEAERMVVRDELRQINALRLDRLLAGLGETK